MMTTAMKEAFGYDDLGNAPRLLAEMDRLDMERGIKRAGGGVICSCGVLYHNHPPVQGALWLTRTCQGLFKL